MNSIKRFLLAGALAVGIQPESLSYDKTSKNLTPDAVIEIYDSSVKVQTEITLEQRLAPLYMKQSTRQKSGSGVVLVDEDTREMYVLTADHVLPSSTGLEDDKKIANSKVTIVGMDTEIYKRDVKKDLALLKLEYSFLTPFKGKLAEKQEIGDYVLGSGFPIGKPKLLYTGVISGKRKEQNVDLYTMVDANINYGDSGGGVFVLEEGKPFLAGLILVKYKELSGVGGMTPISHLREFLKGTPLEDEYL